MRNPRPLLLATLASLLALAPALARSAAPLDEARFTEAYAAWLRKALPDAKVEIAGPLHVRFTPKGGEQHHGFLDNAWRDYQRDPSDLPAIFDRYGGTALEAVKHGRSKEGPVDPRRIVPVIKDRAWLEDARRTVAGVGAKSAHPLDLVYEDYNGVLLVVYAEDQEKGIAYLTPTRLASAGVARAELRALAVKNLGALIPSVDLRGGDGTFMVTAGGNYEASLLLQDALWEKLAREVKGELVVAVPSRDVLLVTGSRDAAGVEKLREAARQIVGDGNYTLTDQLFIRRGGTFVPWSGKP